MNMQVKQVTQEQMLKRVARYKKLVFPPQRYPDSQLPGHERRNYLVVGTGLVVDGGNDPLSAIPINEGFTLSYVEAKPGNGPKLHNHDTNETFIAVKGRWRVIWGEQADQHVDLDQMDLCSVPPFVPRRFVNISEGDPNEYGLLISIQAGDQPKAEFLE